MEHLEHCPIYWLPAPLLTLGLFSEVVFLRYRNKIRKRAFSLGSFVGEFGPQDEHVILQFYAPMTEEEMEPRESDDDYYTEEEEDQEDDILEEETVEETVEESPELEQGLPGCLPEWLRIRAAGSGVGL